MKIFFVILLSQAVMAVHAQVVNIPDINFKNYLVNDAVINTNGDGEIQVSEALSVVDLSIPSNVLDATGIRFFANLKNLYSWNASLANLNVSGLTALEIIDWQFSSLATLDISGCTNLKILKINSNNIAQDLDLRNFPNLEIFWGDDNPISTINAEGAAKLREFRFCPGSMNHTQLVNLRNCDSLKLVSTEFYGGLIDYFDMSGSGVVKFEGGCSLGHLSAVGCVNLKDMDYHGGWVYGIDLQGCVNLQYIRMVMSCYAPVIDLSSCSNLQACFFDIFVDSYINIKNGSYTSLDFLSLSGNVSICADDFEIHSVDSVITTTHFGRVFPISSNCSFTPGGAYNTIKGKVTIDYDNNGCGVGDGGMRNVPIRISDGTGTMITRHTAPTGQYAHYPYSGNFTLTPYFAYPYFNLTPTSANVVFDTANNLIDTVDFCIRPNGVHNNLEISFLPIGPARPGFSPSYQLVYKNRGTTTVNGSVQVNFDNSKMGFNNASIPVSNQVPGQLTWNYSNLLPFETRTINMYFTLAGPPINNVGDTLLFLSAINPVVNDETPADNSFILPQLISGSYDPNDKQCLEGSNINIAAVGDYLHYLIRFQNTGTDTAFNVVITDTLQPNLDWTTVDFTSSSHPCTVQQKDNKLEFIFENIKLPWQGINEPASHGFVAFKVKPKSTVNIGDSLNNRAAIYFDFNLPVITNTTTSVIRPASTVPLKLEYFSLSSKDNGNLLTWKTSGAENNTRFEIERSIDGIHFKSISNITATALRCRMPFNDLDEQPLIGKNYYRLKLIEENGSSFYSKILVAASQQDEFAIISVMPNGTATTVYLNARKQQAVHLRILAADGRVVYKGKEKLNAGSTTVKLLTGELARGIYTLAVDSESTRLNKRFVR